MPGIAWLEIDFEAETAVGIRPARLGLCRGNGNRAAEIGVAVTRAQLLLRLGPVGYDPTAANNVVRLDLENISEITAHRDFKLEACPVHAVVGNVEILVHAAVDHSTDDEAKRTGRDDAVDGLNAAIGEIDARRKVDDGPPRSGESTALRWRTWPNC